MRNNPRPRLLLAALLTVPAHAALLAALPAGVVDTVYAPRVYPPLARLVAWLPRRLPFSLAEVLALLLPAALVGIAWTRGRRLGLRRALGRTARDLLVAAIFLFHGFYVLWGYHYYGTPLARRLHLPRPGAAEVRRAAGRLLRRVRPPAVFPRPRNWARLDRDLNALLRRACARLGLPHAPAGAPLKPVLPPGLLAALGSLGVVSPWTLEPHVEPDLPAPWLVFVAAHEKAHLRGFARESEAGFVAWLALSASGDPRLRYAAALGVLGPLVARDPDLRRRAPPALRRDVAALEAYRRRHLRRGASRLIRRVYDVYLRAHRVAGGVADYGRTLALVAAWEARP